MSEGLDRETARAIHQASEALIDTRKATIETTRFLDAIQERLLGINIAVWLLLLLQVTSAAVSIFR
jgi:hypothetical protein